MQITLKKEGAVSILGVSGRMDANSAPEFEKKMSELLGENCLFFVVNFQELEYISSAGLRGVLASAKRAKAKQGDIFVCGLHGTVDEVFKLTGFNSIFKVFEKEEDAVKQFKA